MYPVTSIEQCECPEGYAGNSCESCADGYAKDANGNCQMARQAKKRPSLWYWLPSWFTNLLE